MLGGVGPGRELPFDARLREHGRIRDQGVHRIDRLVQVVLDRVEIAVVGIDDLRRDVALRDPIHVVRSHVERPDHRVQHVVHDLKDLGVLVRCRMQIGPGIQFPFGNRLGKFLDGIQQFPVRMDLFLIPVSLRH